MKLFKVVPASNPGCSLLVSEEKLGNWPRYSVQLETKLAERLAGSVNQHAALVAVAEAAWLFIQWIPIEAAEKFGADLEYGDLKQALLSLKSIRKEGK